MLLRGRPAEGRKGGSLLHLQRALGNQAAQRILQTDTQAVNAGLRGMASPGFGQDFSRIPVHTRTAGALQTKLNINAPGDRYEQEADRISEQVMRMESPDTAHSAPPVIQRLDAGFQEGLSAKHLQRLCSACEEEEEALQLKAGPAGAGPGAALAQPEAEARVNAVGGGQPLTSEQRAFFEPRFGADFSRVRIHADGSADAAARAVGAVAYTRGSDIVFRQDQYRPHTLAGRQLLAHELTHVVQQGAAPDIRRRSANEGGETRTEGSPALMRVAGDVLQCYPGDGLPPPGDCRWGTYLGLHGTVDATKTVVNSLGGCGPGDSCISLAIKIAAITAEIAARIALDTKCFRGGNKGHRRQVNDKVTMVTDCWRAFMKSNCSQELIEAQNAVIERVLKAVEAAAMIQLAIVALALLIYGILTLIQVIIAAASAGAVLGTLATVGALLLLIREYISSDDDGPPTA